MAVRWCNDWPIMSSGLRRVCRSGIALLKTSDSFWTSSVWNSIPSYGFSKKAKKGDKHSKGGSGSVHDILAELEDVVSLTEAENRMKKSIEHLKGELANIRSGRATPGMLDHMTVESPTGVLPLKAVGTVTVKDSHLLSISLFDAESSPAVVTAIEASPLKLQSKIVNDQELLVTLPKQTQETLDSLSKLVSKQAEHSKSSIRMARKFGMDQVKSLTSKDDKKRGEKAVESLTEQYVHEIDDLCQHKKRELGSNS